MLSRLHAGWLLAWSLLETLVLRLLRPGRAGLAKFESNYEKDRLLPLTTDQRVLLPSISGCIACGRCDVGQGTRMAESDGTYRGLMAFVLSATRSLPDFDAAAVVADRLSTSDLVALQRRCPADIPFSDLAAFVRDKAKRMPAA